MVPHPPTNVCWYIWTICSYLSLTISSLSLLSLKSFPSSLVNLSSSICNFRWSLVSHFSPTDETAANEALSSVGSLIHSFSKDFHKFVSLFLVTNVHLKICLFFQNHRTLPEFWHCWSCTCIPLAAISTALHCPYMFTALLPWQCWHVKQKSRPICMFECFPFLKWDITN